MDIINKIFYLVDDRRINPKEKSYTNYLLNEGIDKVCKKIGEEATEVVIASKNESKEDLINEICDLVYHTIILMNIKQINVEDVENKLKERYKIPNNKKKFNKRGEY